MESSMMKEYIYLQEKIKEQNKLKNILYIVMIILITIIFVFIFTRREMKSFVLLTPFMVILPLSTSIAKCEMRMAKISAYLIVFIESKLEGIKWETRNNIMMNECYELVSISQKKIQGLCNYGYVIISLICYILYLEVYLSQLRKIYYRDMIFLLLPVLLVLWEVVITKKINNIYKVRHQWINKWTRISIIHSDVEMKCTNSKRKYNKDKVYDKLNNVIYKVALMGTIFYFFVLIFAASIGKRDTFFAILSVIQLFLRVPQDTGRKKYFTYITGFIVALEVIVAIVIILSRYVTFESELINLISAICLLVPIGQIIKGALKK